MPRAATLPHPTFAVHRASLANGLRVVLAPDRAAPVVGIAVLYDVGFRSEPQGRTGFAHLFEHLMFQGSATLDKLEHFRYVQGSGGVFNGSTHFDYTNYFEALPANALERGLFLEADRMRRPRITQENLDNQLAVVKEEIRVNVLNRPYGGFPWLHLPPVLFDTFANSHNGYGGFEDLESATTADAEDFFSRYYPPANAVLCVAGDLDIEPTLEMIERHFGNIPGGSRPERPDFGEPGLTSERRSQVHDLHAPIPAVAIGYRVPDPVRELDRMLAFVVLADALSDGDASRLQRRLVQQQRLVTDVGAYIGEFGDPFDERDPSAMTITAHYPDPSRLDRVLEAVDEELAAVAETGLLAAELDRVRTRLVATLSRELDSVMNRALDFGRFELLHGRAELVQELPTRLAGVTADDVSAAAATLRPQNRAVVELVPGAVG